MKKGIKNYVVLIAFIMLFSNINAQNVDANRLEANKELLKQFSKAEHEAEQRVLDYLQNNPQVKRHTSKENGGVMSIVDIVNGKPLYMGTDNLEAAKATGVTQLQTGGLLGLNLDGTAMTVLVWDGGPVQTDHVEFMDATNTQTRVTNMESSNTDGSSDIDDHATHVSGTISAKGVNTAAKGMATNVTVVTYNFLNANTEIISALTGSSTNLLLSNHSYGVVIYNDGELTVDPSYIGSYESGASADDGIHHNNPYHLKVTSAGNNGTVSYTGGLVNGLDKLAGSANAKNNLVIANANPSVIEQPAFSGNYVISNLVINPSSSQGPTDDLRVKPDIAADGTNLLSPVPTDSYASFTGTSMSAPNTTGALVLLQQYFEQLNGVYMKSSTIKGLVCHTAIDDINTVGPDPRFGWGFLNAKASAETIAEDFNGESIIEELTLDQGQTYTYTFAAQGGETLKATICWTDMPGDLATAGVDNDPTPRLVNDLDLRLEKDGTTFFPWKLNYSASSGISNSKADNSVDNVEKIEIETPVAGSYTLTVSHKGMLEGNVGGPFDPQSQDFSLILTGESLTLGVKDNAISNSLAVFPNPNNGEFTISFNSNASNNEDVKVDIYDLQGRLVYNNSFSNESIDFKKTINLSGVASGVYIANISKGTNTVSHKIIIE